MPLFAFLVPRFLVRSNSVEGGACTASAPSPWGPVHSTFDRRKGVVVALSFTIAREGASRRVGRGVCVGEGERGASELGERRAFEREGAGGLTGSKGGSRDRSGRREELTEFGRWVQWTSVLMAGVLDGGFRECNRYINSCMLSILGRIRATHRERGTRWSARDRRPLLPAR